MLQRLLIRLGLGELYAWWQRQAQRRARRRMQVRIPQAPDRSAVVDNWTRHRK